MYVAGENCKVTLLFEHPSYVGDGDSKTYSLICKAVPYEDLAVQKRNALGMYRKEWAHDYEI